MNYDRRRQQAYRDQIEELRRIVARTPMWDVTVRDGRPALVSTHTNELLVPIEGRWTPDLCRFFNVVHQFSMLNLLTLLEKAAGQACQPEAERLLGWLERPRSGQVRESGVRGAQDSA